MRQITSSTDSSIRHLEEEHKTHTKMETKLKKEKE